MSLTAKQRKHLKTLAHHRQFVVQVGNAGITPSLIRPSLIREISQALDFHELIKIRLPGVERAQRNELLGLICDATGAEAVQEIGRIAVVYRRADKPRIKLPVDGEK